MRPKRTDEYLHAQGSLLVLHTGNDGLLCESFGIFSLSQSNTWVIFHTAGIFATFAAFRTVHWMSCAFFASIFIYLPKPADTQLCFTLLQNITRKICRTTAEHKLFAVAREQ
jgi:hypothetical protein